MHYAFDPGGTTGYAVSDERGKLVDYGQLRKGELMVFLDQLKDPTFILAEEFLIDPKHNFSYNPMETIRILGMLEYSAHVLQVPFILQSRTIKSIGYKWAGLPVPKDHSLSHQTDAWAHLVYYNHKKLGLNIPALKRMVNEI